MSAPEGEKRERSSGGGVPAKGVKKARLASSAASASSSSFSPLEDLAIIQGVLKRSPFDAMAQEGIFARGVSAQDIEARWAQLLRAPDSMERFAGMSREASGLLYGGYQEPLVGEVEEEALRRALVVDPSAEGMLRVMQQNRAAFHYRRTPKTLSKHLRNMRKAGQYDRFSHPFITQMRNNVEQSDGTSLTEPPDIQLLGLQEGKPILNSDVKPRRADIMACRDLELVEPTLLVKDDLTGVSFEQMEVQVLAFADASLFAPLAGAEKLHSVCVAESAQIEQLLQAEGRMRAKMSGGALARIYGEHIDMPVHVSPLYLTHAKLGRVEVCASSAGIDQVVSLERVGDHFVLHNINCKSASVNGCPVVAGKRMRVNSLAFVQVEMASFIIEF